MTPQELELLKIKKRLLKFAKDRAKKRGLEFTLTPADLFIPTHCPILGFELRINYKGLTGNDFSPSLDRIDNSKGYTPDNVVVVSFRANRIKKTSSADELIKIGYFYRNLTLT